MDEARRAAIERALAELRAEHGPTLRRNAAELAAALLAPDGDARSRDELLRAAHRLHGAAASYGLPAIGAVASRIELLLEARERGEAMSDVDLADAAAELERAARS